MRRSLQWSAGRRKEVRRRLALSIGLVVSSACSGVPEPAAAGTRAGLHFTRVSSGDLATDAYSSPSASWMDLDGDGREDLYVLNGFASLDPGAGPQRDVLYRNDGGVFVSIPGHPLTEELSFSGSATWGDYDNDGDPDVYVANQRGPNHLFRNDGAGAFAPVPAAFPAADSGRSFSATWVDVDSDGWLDLHVTNGRDGEGEGERDFLYRALGEGRFAPVAAPLADEPLPSGGAAWADFDADGDVDLLLPVYSGQGPRLFRNDGDWRFSEVAAEVGLSPDPLPGWPRSSVAHWVDFDNDLDLDLFIGNTGGTIDFLFENDGTGRFRRIDAGRVGLDATYVSDALWADLDNDGDQDLVLAVWGGASEVYLNDGRGALRPVVAGDLGAEVHFASSVSTSDVDGDGDLDLFFTQWPINEAGGAVNPLYVNNGRNGNWLNVELEGTRSNRSGLGAEVVIEARIEGRRVAQSRHLSARTSWRSANGHRLHFGLGDAEHVDAIRVRWPSGQVDTLTTRVPANSLVRIREGLPEEATWTRR